MAGIAVAETLREVEHLCVDRPSRSKVVDDECVTGLESVDRAIELRP